MVLGQYLSYIKVTASEADVGEVEGLCGGLGGETKPLPSTAAWR